MWKRGLKGSDAFVPLRPDIFCRAVESDKIVIRRRQEQRFEAHSNDLLASLIIEFESVILAGRPNKLS
jgi:hypothetical protein